MELLSTRLYDQLQGVYSFSRDVWFQAIGATLLISAAPFFILFFIPLDNSEEKQWLLKIVLRFLFKLSYNLKGDPCYTDYCDLIITIT